MPDRIEQLLRRFCLVLVAAVVLRLIWVVLRPNPLAHLTIPAVPVLATNAEPAAVKPPQPPAIASPGPGTETNARTATNAVAGSTNTVATTTNAALTVKTNLVATNRNAAPPGMNPGPRRGGMLGGGPGKPPAPLDPLVQARIEKIVQSELLGPVQRPLPMALLGIAGADVFLRAANGQSGLVRVGGEVGGIKLLRIGINRVLVEEAGVKKELTIFNGAGSESLLTP